MSDQVSRYEDLERTDVLPQLRCEPENAEDNDPSATAILSQTSVMRAVGLRQEVGSQAGGQTSGLTRVPKSTEAAPFGAVSKSSSDNGALHTLPSKPTPTDLAVGGIRGKIADLESKLVEAQDQQADLNRQCQQLMQRCHEFEARASKAEASYVVQTTDLYRTSQRAKDAEQRLLEERVQFEARIVDIDGQLVDARTRADKRASTLEHLLADQTDRAMQSEGKIADARMEIEKIRADLGTKLLAIQGLEERLAKQTQVAADISRLYATQTGQIASLTAAMDSEQAKAAELQTAKVEGDQRIAMLQEQVAAAIEAAAKSESSIAMQRRHIEALEQGLLSRDRRVDELKELQAKQALAFAEVDSAKTELEKRLAETQIALTAAQAAAANQEENAMRLSVDVRNRDRQVGDLTAAQQTAEQALRDRDAAIVQAAERARSTQEELSRAIEKASTLQARLDKQEQDIDGMQAQLQTRNTELKAEQDLVLVLQRQHGELHADKDAGSTAFVSLQQTTQKLLAERDQLELENQAGRAELSRSRERYEEAVQTILASRESISAREQQQAVLERELRATLQRLEEAHARGEHAMAASAALDDQLRERDKRIEVLEEKLAEHASALNAIGQDIERVHSANPSEKLAAMGYALESLDTPGVKHRLTRMTTTAGRSASNDIEINSSSVSRFHARIVVKPEGVWLIDLQSTNGCGVNGRRASRQILCDGDAVRIGHCMFRFSVLGAEALASVQSEQSLSLDSASAPALTDQMLPDDVLFANKNAENRVQHH